MRAESRPSISNQLNEKKRKETDLQRNDNCFQLSQNGCKRIKLNCPLKGAYLESNAVPEGQEDTQRKLGFVRTVRPQTMSAGSDSKASKHVQEESCEQTSEKQSDKLIKTKNP